MDVTKQRHPPKRICTLFETSPFGRSGTSPLWGGIVATSGLREKLERLAEVLGIEGATRNMAELIEKALELALEKKDPMKKLERRRKREAARSKTSPDEAATEATRETPGGEGSERPRYVPSSVRERLLERALSV